MRNKDKPWFNYQCKHAFGLKQEAHLLWTRDHSRITRKSLSAGKQSREAVDLPLTYHPSPSFTTFAFRSSEVKSLLIVRLGCYDVAVNYHRRL